MTVEDTTIGRRRASAAPPPGIVAVDPPVAPGMTTLAIIGAGAGLGAAVARRFGAEGFSVGLISRNQSRVDALADTLAKDGVSARGFAADVRDPASIASALEQVTETLGPIEVLQYSPLPQKDFMRPVLETTPADMVGPVEFSIYGPIAAVHQVLPGMRFLGENTGTILFVNGGSAVKPGRAVTGTSIAFAGQAAYAQLLHEELKPEGIHVSQLIIGGAISADDPRKSPEALADHLWVLHTGRDRFRLQVSED
ncbi:SDR family NAD(P)-dependent oxidoreductase [Williamsia herbipolensis]|uniref:SDR family NAD(P)-dependent oxidoreductase n=1 Tax=Williamsia herbipolensis TaxID=1603258 RepID=UPI001EEFD71B|nr:SDR family NAD(P)-dependent oxidoreductase [Williamsia herbipolensis]